MRLGFILPGGNANEQLELALDAEEVGGRRLHLVDGGQLGDAPLLEGADVGPQAPGGGPTDGRTLIGRVA
jgi:hypothetical protein